MTQKKHLMVTCYDATFARLIARSEAIDSVLVGDSLGMVIQGAASTLEVSLDDIIYHTRAVRRGLGNSRSPILIADMPIHSYENSSLAVENAQRLIDAGADMVKVEGPVEDSVRALRAAAIRVCGHIGLTPQTIQDYKVQGRNPAAAARLKQEARCLEEAGCEMLVLEMIPRGLAREITTAASIATIGIGSGADCSGQVLVLYDLLGLNLDFNPRFLKRFTEGGKWTMKALQDYRDAVCLGHFPSQENSFQ